MDTTDLLAPSVDPKTRKLGIRRVAGANDAGTRTVIQVRHFDPVVTDEPDTMGGTNTAPSPLEMALVSLVGCEGVILNGCAKALNFAYSGVEFECSSQIDLRGPKGVPGVRPYFETVDLKITLATDEPQERLEKLRKNVEFRCPILNLMRAADVELNVEWERVPAGTEASAKG